MWPSASFTRNALIGSSLGTGSAYFYLDPWRNATGVSLYPSAYLSDAG
jgi:hypothetical protein